MTQRNKALPPRSEGSSRGNTELRRFPACLEPAERGQSRTAVPPGKDCEERPRRALSSSPCPLTAPPHSVVFSPGRTRLNGLRAIHFKTQSRETLRPCSHLQDSHACKPSSQLPRVCQPSSSDACFFSPRNTAKLTDKATALLILHPRPWPLAAHPPSSPDSALGLLHLYSLPP